jgi:transcriptional antiterminator RfaH
MSPSSNIAKTWYLVTTKVRQERLAKENLDRQGYEVYLPMLRVRRKRRGKFVHVVEPMFPRYLFVRLDQKYDNWSPIRSTYGVSGIVYFGSIPARVSDELIGALKQKADENGVQTLLEPELQVGDSVRIAEGVMAGYEGIIHAKNSKERILILLDIAGKYTKVDVSIEHIERSS